jgi:hypothetical protein
MSMSMSPPPPLLNLAAPWMGFAQRLSIYVNFEGEWITPPARMARASFLSIGYALNLLVSGAAKFETEYNANIASGRIITVSITRT